MATAARAAIVVGEVFEDEAAGELQLRYMSCLDGVPLDKAARTHEKLRTLSDLLSPFITPESSDTLVPITIDVSRLPLVSSVNRHLFFVLRGCCIWCYFYCCVCVFLLLYAQEFFA